MGLRLRLMVVLRLAAFLVVFATWVQAEEVQVEPRITQPINEHVLRLLKGNTHPLAQPRFDQGEAPADLPMQRMLLVLKRSEVQEHALRHLLDAQQDKASTSYHKWLTPEQFGKQFGPADQDMQVVTSWLQTHGFQIGNAAKGRNIIEFSGTAAQVKEAFHTSIHKYVVKGEEHWANSSDPQIPAALAPVVAGVHTLHNFLKKPMLQFSGEKVSGKYVQGKPQLTFSDGTHGLGPFDYGTIYNILPVWNNGVAGQGRTIAVVGRSNLFEGGQDVYNFANIFGQGPGVNIVLNGPDPGDVGGGEEGEATLDATWTGAVAPNAVIDLVVSATTNDTDGVDLSEIYIIDNNLADIMTESFSGCEAGMTQTEADSQSSLAEQAAAQGITYLVSSGDSGAEGCDDPSNPPATGPLSINGLGSTPFTVTVGGTMFNENSQDSKYWTTSNGNPGFGSALSYIPEDVWNESCTGSGCGLWAGGGGSSIFFSKPAWQTGVPGIPSGGARDVPDVSLTAAGHDPYLLCLEGSCVPDSNGQFFVYFVSGTSASAPSFAGIMALVDQQMNGRQGQANYVLYRLAASKGNFSKCNGSNTSGLPASTCIFNDVTVGNNVVPGESGTQYQSGAGYDLATGLGSVNVANLVSNWNSVTFNSTTTTILSPSSNVNIVHGQPVTFNVTVTSSKGTPTGSVSLVTSNNQSIGVFPLTSFPVQVSNLPGGPAYTVTAYYGGDGNFGASNSAASPLITVTPENSSTTLQTLTIDQNFNFINFTGGPYGSFVYLRADVASQSGNGIPTGNVNFMDGASNIQGNPYVLNSKGNTATANFANAPNGGTPTGLFTLAPGPHSITANYLGDASFNASNSTPAANFTITQANTSTTVTYTGAPKGAAITATVRTNSGGVPPAGGVLFYMNGVLLGYGDTNGEVPATVDPKTGALVGAGLISLVNDTSLSNGSYVFSAKFVGDTNYLASTSANVPAKIQADFGFTSGANVVNIAAPGGMGSLGLTVTAWDGFNGAVTFACSALPAGAKCNFSPSSVTGGGNVQVSITTTAASSRLLKPEMYHRVPWEITSGGFVFAGILLVGVPRSRRRLSRLTVLAVLSLLFSLPGCGGGSSSSSTTPVTTTPTPIGSSAVTITATSGSLSHPVNFTLNVE